MDQAFFVRLFTHHPVAKLAAIGLAVLLMYLIDRELMVNVYDEEVLIVAVADEGDRHRLEISVPEKDYIVVDDRTRAKIVIRGHKRDRSTIRHPFRVRLLDQIIKAVLGEDELAPVPIEAKDIVVGDLEVSLPFRVEVRVAKLRTTTKLLSVSAAGEGGATATISPSSVEIMGPRSVPGQEAGDPVRGLISISSVALTVTKDTTPADLKRRIEDLVKRRHKWCRVVPGQTWTLSFATEDEEPDEINISGIGLRLEIIPTAEYPLGEFEFQPPSGPKNWTLTVTFKGPKSKIEALKKDQDLKQRLADEFFIRVPAGEAANSIRSDLINQAEKDPEKWHGLSTFDLSFPDVLGKYGVQHDVGFTLKARMRKKSK